MLKESVSEAEGTANMVWSAVKPNITSTSPVEPQNPSNFSEVSCKSKMKQREKSNKALRHLGYPFMIWSGGNLTYTNVKQQAIQLMNHGHMPLKSEVSYEAGTSFKVLKRVIVLGRIFMLLLISFVL